MQRHPRRHSPGEGQRMTSQTSDSLAHTREDRAWRTQEERRKLGQDLGERVFLEHQGPRTRARAGLGTGSGDGDPGGHAGEAARAEGTARVAGNAFARASGPHRAGSHRSRSWISPRRARAKVRKKKWTFGLNSKTEKRDFLLLSFLTTKSCFVRFFNFCFCYSWRPMLF